MSLPSRSLAGQTATCLVWLSLLASGVVEGAEGAWTVLPINGGGNMQTVEIAPSDPNVWYTYADVGGPYRSDDAGRSWRPIHSNMPQTMRGCWADHVRTLTVDPRDPDRIVFASGWHVGRKPAGVYVSRDGGRTYQRTLKGNFHGEGNRKRTGKVLRRDPRDPDRILAVTDTDGIFLSRDGGDTWVSCGADGCWFVEVWFDLAVSGRAYACAPTWWSDEDSAGGRERGFFRSTDGGVSWKKISDASPFELTQIRGATDLVGIFLVDGGSEIRLSRDGGDTWCPLMEGLPTPARAKAEKDPNGAFYQAVAAGTDCYFTAGWGGAFYRLTATERVWKEIPIERLEMTHPEKENGIADRKMHVSGRPCTCDIVVDPRNENHILTTDWFHIWQTFDGGRTWKTSTDGIHPLVPFTIACDPHSADNISYGCADMGMFNSQDGGKTFLKERGICGANSIDFCRKTPHRGYAVGGKCGIQLMITEDGGRTWRYSKYKGLPGLGQKDGQHGVYTVAVDPTTDWPYLCVSGRIAPNEGGVYRSRDGGDTWEWFSDGMDGDTCYKSSEFCFGGPALWPEQFVFGPDGSAVTYGPYTGKMFRLDREKGRWTHVDVWNKSGRFTLAADPHRAGRFLLATDDHITELVEGGRKVNRCLVGSQGIGHAVAFDPHTPGLVAASSSDAEDICMSTDGGRHWTCLVDGMKIPTGTQHKLVLDRQRLFVLTRGSGVWVRNIGRNPAK